MLPSSNTNAKQKTKTEQSLRFIMTPPVENSASVMPARLNGNVFLACNYHRFLICPCSLRLRFISLRLYETLSSPHLFSGAG